MAKTADKLKSADNEMLKAWYADSLSLIQPSSVKSGTSGLPNNSSMWQPCLGIVLASANGDELWANGNSETCRSYIQGRSIGKIAKTAMLVEQFEDGLIIATGTREVIRVIFIDHEALMSILREAVPGVELSNSEFQLLMQILCGMSLKQASEADNVSYETKRSQFKSLAARTEFRSQSEVIRNTLLGLTTYALDSIGSFPAIIPAPPNETEAFLSMYYPGVFRFHQIATGEGRTLRVAETGPLTGTPIIFLHSQTLPSPDQFLADWTTQKDVRLIIPFREGFLGEAKNRYAGHEHLERCTQDIAGTIELFCNGRARVVANSTGTAYAVNLAVNYPDHVDRLTICAAAYVGKYENQPVSRFVRGIKNLASKNEMLIAKIFERYMSKMSNLAGTLEVLKSSYENSPLDMEIFTNLLSNPVGHSWMYESYRMSRYSVVTDIAMGGHDVWQHAHKINCPVLFVHGRADPINSVADARKAAKLIANSEFVELEEDGQSLFIRRMADLITLETRQWSNQTVA